MIRFYSFVAMFVMLLTIAAIYGAITIDPLYLLWVIVGLVLLSGLIKTIKSNPKDII